MPIHSIQLRGPWHLASLPAIATSPPSAVPPIARINRLDPPCLLLNSLAPWRLQRHFHAPTGVRENERVALVIDTSARLDRLWFDLDLIPFQPAAGGLQADLGLLARGRHLLTLDLVPPIHGSDARLQSIRLEIHSDCIYA